MSKHNSLNGSFFKGELNKTCDSIDYQKISDDSLSNDLSDTYEQECKGIEDIEQELDQEFNEIENESRMKQKLKEEFLRSESSSRDANEVKKETIEPENAKKANEPRRQSTENQQDPPQYKYLFRNTRYFLIKSINHENIDIAKSKVLLKPKIFI